MNLHVPNIDDPLDVLATALAWAGNGWYVGPLLAANKSPGSVLGASWPTKTSNEPKQIIDWFVAAEEGRLGAFAHMGPSGAYALDADVYERLNVEVREELERLQPPFQSTRTDDSTRGHYLLEMPTDRMLGNGGAAKLGSGWGEVRGVNGVIVVAGRHEKPNGRYQVVRPGPVPSSPLIDGLLPDAQTADRPATNDEVERFLDTHVQSDRSELATVPIRKMKEAIDAGSSRHDATRDALCFALREAGAGLYPARPAVDTIESVFTTAFDGPDSRDPDPGEWARLVSWAVAQAELADPAEVAAGVAQRVGRAVSTVTTSTAGTAGTAGTATITRTETAGDAGDVANARRFVTAHGDRFRYFARARRWLVYADGVWTEDPDRVAARAAAEQVARDMLTEAAQDPDRDRAKALAQEARRTMTARRLDAMLHVAEPHLPVRADQLDADPWLLNVTNGVVDLRTGELLPHDPNHLMTRQARAAYHPDAIAPTFGEFLTEVQTDPDVRAFLARLTGAALVGLQRDHVLPIAHGTGANGKSTFYGALGTVLGTYAGKLDVSVLVGRSPDRSGATPELVALRGLRLAVADEPDAGARLREAHVKALTGGDRIVARPLYGDPIEFDPAHLLTIVTNHQPEVTGADDGIWRRLLLVPWTVQVAEQDRDTDLPSKLAAEADGILAWAVAGCLAWQRDGLAPPAQIRAATSQYRSAQDHVAAFLEDRCLLSATVSVPNGQLRGAYEAWCEREGIDPLNATVFGSQLNDRGLAAGKSKGRRVRKGVALLPDDGLEEGGSA